MRVPPLHARGHQGRPGLGIELDEDYLADHPYQGVKLWPGLRYDDWGLADV